MPQEASRFLQGGGGMGLLARNYDRAGICLSELKRTGGRIRVNSAAGKGSTFCFVFPLREKQLLLGNA